MAVPDAATRRRPVQLTAAAALTALEGLAALVFGVLEIGEIRLFRAVVGVGVALLMIGFAVLLLAAARGLLRVRRWARGPVVALQLIIGLTGWSFRGGETTPVAVVMIAVAVVTLVLVLHPASTRALVGEPGGETSA
jgi:hypothetical protein